MKIRVINLLNKKEKPKQIKYKNYIWSLDANNLYHCENVEIDLDVYLASVQVCDLGRNLIDVLNDEVEILEEKPKEIEQINFRNEKGETLIGANMWEFYYKLEEIRKAINYLLKKEDKIGE